MISPSSALANWLRGTSTGRRATVIVWNAANLTVEDRQKLEALVQGILSRAEGGATLIEELWRHLPLPSSEGPDLSGDSFEQ